MNIMTTLTPLPSNKNFIGKQISLLFMLCICLELLPIQKKNRFSLCLVTAQPMRDCHNSANKKPHTLNSQFPPMDILFITVPPNFPFSMKEFPLLCFTRHAVLHQWQQRMNCSSLILPNKSILLVKIFCCFVVLG